VNRVDTLVTNRNGAETAALRALRKKLPKVILA
jgi:hypothetical protein